MVKSLHANAGNMGLIPGLGRCTGEGMGYPLQCPWASLVAQSMKNLPVSAGDAGSVPGSGRCPGGGNGNPLQDSCLGDHMGIGVWWVAKSQTRLSN